MNIEIPEFLSWLADEPGGRQWFDALPEKVDRARHRWSLEVGPPFPGSFVSWVAPAETQDGEDVVLKIQFPDRESAGEAVALDAWDGNGAVQILDRDEGDHALLLERCVPGSHLGDEPSAVAFEAMLDLLPRLWVDPLDEIGSLADEADRWAAVFRGKRKSTEPPTDTAVIDAALEAIEHLVPSQGPQVLVNQDMHPHNVLAAQREPWLAIDPKPLIGEREFGLAPMIRAPELGHNREAVIHRLDVATTRLGLDRDRTRLWTMVHTLAWGFDGPWADQHQLTVRWLLDA